MGRALSRLARTRRSERGASTSTTTSCRPPYVDAAGDALRRQAPDFAFVLSQWSPAHSIEAMDASGIATAVTSLSTPGVFQGDVQDARRLARACNEYAAGMARTYPGRLGFWATLPMPDVEGSLNEIAYAMDVLKADGIGFLSDYGDKWLGDPAFAAVFAELQRRKAIVFVHPSVANCCRTLLPGVPPAVAEFVLDTTRTIVSLLFNGTFTRSPDVRFIFAQAGGTMPMISDRIAHNVKPELAATMPLGPLGELKKLYFRRRLVHLALRARSVARARPHRPRHVRYRLSVFAHRVDCRRVRPHGAFRSRQSGRQSTHRGAVAAALRVKGRADRAAAFAETDRHVPRPRCARAKNHLIAIGEIHARFIAHRDLRGAALR